MHPDLLLSSYHYDLPESSIAQHPAERRDASRLLVYDKKNNLIQHKQFFEIVDLIAPGDLLVVNDTKVFPARFLGKKDTGGRIEVFFLSYPEEHTEKNGATVEALLKCSKRPKPGSSLLLDNNLLCVVKELRSEGKALLHLEARNLPLKDILYNTGHIPLPPYIHRENAPEAEDAKRYQTVYANKEGAVAAPTAGLHFSQDLIGKLTLKGIGLASITLHVGYGTFSPVRTERITEHCIHEEFMEISQETAEKINTTKANHGRIWAVGTTSVRALEFAAQHFPHKLQAMSGWCNLYIYPGFQFRLIDNLITNFHLPSSSLMFLVAALCGRTHLLDCYNEAISSGYRFYSYGDAMAIIN